MVTVDTRTYEATHGHTPRQSRHYAVSPWAFQIDQDEAPVFITARYTEAVQQAKARAQCSITVLP